MEKGSACSQAHCFLFKSPPTRVCLNVAGRDLRVEVAGAGAGHRISANLSGKNLNFPIFSLNLNFPNLNFLIAVNVAICESRRVYTIFF